METNKNQQLSLTSNNSFSVYDNSNMALMRIDKEKKRPRYGQLLRNQRLDFLCREMSKAIILKHEELDVDMLPVEADALDVYLMESADARDLILPEIEYAFRHGLVGAYGEYFGITPISMSGFVSGYVKSKKKWDITWEESKLSGWNEARAETIRRLEAHKREVEEARSRENETPGRFEPKMVNEVISSEEHRAKIKAQAEQIFREAGL